MSQKNKTVGRILSEPIDSQYVPDCSVGEFYFKKLHEHADKIGQIDAKTSKSETYREMLFKSICVAQEMQARGIVEDDKISICSYNTMETILPYLAAAFLQNKLSSLDPSLPLDDMRYLLSITKPKMIFAVPESEEALETVLKELDLKTELIIFGETTRNTAFKEFLVERGTESTFKPKPVADLRKTAFIFCSSGTTGMPKGTCLNRFGLLYSANVFGSYFNSEIVLHYSTPYWISYFLLFTSTITQGGCRLIVPAFGGSKILHLIEKFKITCILLPQSYIYAVTTNPDIKKYDLSSIKTILTGGGLTTKEQLAIMNEIFPNCLIIHGYGMTELSGVCTAFNPKIHSHFIASKKSSCGKLLPGITVKIVDPETNKILGPYEEGEILVKSKSVMNEYYNKPNETKEVFDEDGFIHTGDVLYYDEDECFYFVTRIKEMFKYRTWHIIPSELEQILLTHPAVKEAVVIGYPHEEDGDHAMAVVVLEDGAKIAENELVKFCNEKVPDRKKLRAGVKFVEDIPKTSTGKYSRLALRNKIIKNLI